MTNIKDKEYVTDVKTVEEFIRKYYKPNRFLDEFKGEGYEACLIASHQKDFDEYGCDLISRHDSITGKAVYFKGLEFERIRDIKNITIIKEAEK